MFRIARREADDIEGDAAVVDRGDIEPIKERQEANRSERVSTTRQPEKVRSVTRIFSVVGVGIIALVAIIWLISTVRQRRER